MITKAKLKNIIDKYYLGINEKVTWEIEDNKLLIDFMSPSKDVIGNITCEEFILEDCSLPIYETKKLLNLVNICGGDLLLELVKEQNIVSKLKISDKDFTSIYSLADALLIGNVGTVNLPEEENVTLKLSPEDIVNLIKAKGALLDIDNMLIKTGEDADGIPICKFIFGDESGYSNKITYQIQGDINNFDIKLPFSSTIFRSILKSNKEAESGEIIIYSEGLMIMKFEEEGIKSEYALVRKSDTNF